MTGNPPDITRHRRPGQGVPGRLGVGVLLVAALAVGAVVNSRTPDTDERERPFVTTGSIGKTVGVRSFDATVLGVRGTMKLARSGKWHETGGVWLLVKIRVEARDEPTEIGYAAVRDAEGRTYWATSRITQPLKLRSLQPGVPVVGEIAFEVPPAVAPTLSIRLAEPSLDTRMDAMADVPLKIKKSTVDQWVADPKIMLIADTEVA